jgi:hypothetical protein
MLRFPEPLLNWCTSASAGGLLPARLREVAILTTGPVPRRVADLLPQQSGARGRPLSERCSGLAAATDPRNSPPYEATGRDIAPALYDGGPLPGVFYREALDVPGEEGTVELIFVIAQYAAISAVLNAGDIPLSQDAA